ncbi:MAG: hypothetical protein P1V97_12695 [Planctomycetota bacterium]|nr:hypothetical protein [Planctomycetota bacterium]
MSEDHEPFVIVDDEDLQLGSEADEQSLREALELARQEHAAGLISTSVFEKIERKVQLLLAKAHKVVEDIHGYIAKRKQEEAEKKAREEAARKAEEARRRAEEERKRKEEEERKRKEEEARQAEEARKQAEEERKRKEEEARKQRELEEMMKEPDLHWRDLESIYGRTRTVGLDQGAFAVKQMYEEALAHQDWSSFAQRIREKYRQDPLPWTFTQIKKAGLLKAMDNIFPPEEANPVVVPGYMIVKENAISDEMVFVIVNVQSSDRFRYTPSSVVRLSDFTPE